MFEEGRFLFSGLFLGVVGGCLGLVGDASVIFLILWEEVPYLIEI